MDDEWISARSAIAVIGLSRLAATRTICRRAHAGLIRARALRFILDDKVRDNFDVPVGFWWADGEDALTQNWETGDFETWLDRSLRLRAFGVTFNRSDIEKCRPSQDLVEGLVATNGKPAQADRIFIGHGHSTVWRDLRDFLRERLQFQTEEFNSVSTAGLSTASRLEEMLQISGFAFLVMTAEDERKDGNFNARLNVIHEIGLFQGRLGLRKAIVMLEEGCEEFSNIRGLGQIRFPKGNIQAEFEEIRRVLEREGFHNPNSE